MVQYSKRKIGRNKVPAYRLELFKKINFPTQDIVNLKWFSRLEEYITAVKNNALGRSLSSWATSQRRDFQKGSMTTKHVEALKSIGFDFTVRPQFNYKVTPIDQHPHFDKFSKLIQEFGCVPYAERPILRVLGKDLKKLYKNNQLPQKSINILNKIGFVLSSDIDARTERAIQRHLEHIKSKKVFNCKSSEWKWVLAMRNNRKEGALKKEIIDRLNEINFEWGP